MDLSVAAVPSDGDGDSVVLLASDPGGDFHLLCAPERGALFLVDLDSLLASGAWVSAPADAPLPEGAAALVEARAASWGDDSGTL
jgi:hypothetical protein